jgi:hypothetical protein
MTIYVGLPDGKYWPFALREPEGPGVPVWDTVQNQLVDFVRSKVIVTFYAELVHPSVVRVLRGVKPLSLWSNLTTWRAAARQRLREPDGGLVGSQVHAFADLRPGNLYIVYWDTPLPSLLSRQPVGDHARKAASAKS